MNNIRRYNRYRRIKVCRMSGHDYKNICDMTVCRRCSYIKEIKDE